MAEELSLDSLKTMKKADFIKAFKNKAIWKKAKSVIVLVDYKLDGKKTTVAIPFKKETEMKQEMKRLKKEKLHVLKKTGAGHINFENDGSEGLKAKVELVLGGLKAELLQMKGTELFGRLQAILEVMMGDDADLDEADDEEEEEDSELEDDSDVNEDSPEDAEMSEADKKAEAKTIIQELARIQLELKGEWSKFKGLVAEKNGALVLIPAYGSMLQNLENFDEKIGELEALAVAEDQSTIFRKNYEALSGQLNAPSLEKLKGAIEKVKQNTLDMVADINAFIEQIDFDKQYLIQI